MSQSENQLVRSEGVDFEEAESLLEEEETGSGVIPDIEANNLREVLEKRRAWEDYSGETDPKLKSIGKLGTVAGGSAVISDLGNYTELGEIGVFFGFPNLIFYTLMKRSEQKGETASKPLREINNSLDSCYIFEGDYDLSEIGGEVTGIQGRPYQEVLNQFRNQQRAREQSIEELKEDYPVDEWEDKWEAFVEDSDYEDGLQVLWISEQEDIHGQTNAYGWKIEVYEESNGDQELVHESYGATGNTEAVNTVRKDGERALHNRSELEDIFDVPNAQSRIRKPS